METNRIENIARDGIHTATQVARAAVQSGSELAGEIVAAAAKLTRDGTQTGEDSGIAILGAVARVLGATRQVGEQAIGLARTMLGGAVEAAGGVTHTAVRVTTAIAIELTHAVRSTVSALFVGPVDQEPPTSQAGRRTTNGGAAELAA